MAAGREAGLGDRPVGGAERSGAVEDQRHAGERRAQGAGVVEPEGAVLEAELAGQGGHGRPAAGQPRAQARRDGRAGDQLAGVAGRAVEEEVAHPDVDRDAETRRRGDAAIPADPGRRPQGRGSRASLPLSPRDGRAPRPIWDRTLTPSLRSGPALALSGTARAQRVVGRGDARAGSALTSAAFSASPRPRVPASGGERAGRGGIRPPAGWSSTGRPGRPARGGPSGASAG